MSVSSVRSRKSSLTMISSAILRSRWLLYSWPRYISVWPRCRAKPCASQTVIRVTAMLFERLANRLQLRRLNDGDDAASCDGESRSRSSPAVAGMTTTE